MSENNPTPEIPVVTTSPTTTTTTTTTTSPVVTNVSPFEDIKPIFGPILLLLKSRKFLIFVSGTIANGIVAMMCATFPSLKPMSDVLITSMGLMTASLIVAIAYEDKNKVVLTANDFDPYLDDPTANDQ